MPRGILTGTMRRRTFITTAGTVSFVGLAGCNGGLPDNLEFTAEPATLESAAATDAGYERQETTSIDIDESIDVAGETRDVKITTWTTSYQSYQGTFIILSTPNAEIAGISANPLTRISGGELIARLLELAGGGEAISDLEATGESEVTVFGETTTVEEFTATLEIGSGESSTGGDSGNFPTGGENGEVPIRLYLLSATHETEESSDVIFSLAFQPQNQIDSERIYALFSSVQHPVSPPQSATDSSQ